MFGSKKEKEIRRVKVLGVRTAENTGIMSGITWNHTSVALLVEYDDRSRELVECVNAKEFSKYIMFIDMD